MKKLLLAAALLMLVCGAWAQPLSHFTVRDTVVIQVQVHMIGLEWSLDTVATGVAATTSMSTASIAWTVSDLDTTARDGWDTLKVDFGAQRPCTDANLIFWVENTGGISEDFHVNWGIFSIDDTLTGTDSTYFAGDSVNRCTINENEAGFYLGIGDYTWDNTAVTDAAFDVAACHLAVPSAPSGRNRFQGWTEVINTNFINAALIPMYYHAVATGLGVIAEDPTSTGDGTRDLTQHDQFEMGIRIVMPSSANSTIVQNFCVAMCATIADH